MLYHNLDLSQYDCSVAAGVEIEVLGLRFHCNCEGEEVLYSSMYVCLFVLFIVYCCCFFAFVCFCFLILFVYCCCFFARA